MGKKSETSMKAMEERTNLDENGEEEMAVQMSFAKRHKSIFQFLKASVASQIASWIDMGLSFVLFYIGMNAFSSKAIGAATGGIINCCINYRWTFQAKDCKPTDVAVKYAMVWVGSWALNSGGTSLFTNLLKSILTFGHWQVSDKICFMVAQIAVSLVVSICWNFLLQRNFVYRNVSVGEFLGKLIRWKKQI